MLSRSERISMGRETGWTFKVDENALIEFWWSSNISNQDIHKVWWGMNHLQPHGWSLRHKIIPDLLSTCAPVPDKSLNTLPLYSSNNDIYSTKLHSMSCPQEMEKTTFQP